MKQTLNDSNVQISSDHFSEEGASVEFGMQRMFETMALVLSVKKLGA